MRSAGILMFAMIVGCVSHRSDNSAMKSDAGVAPLPTPIDEDGPFDPNDAEKIGALFQSVMDQRSPPGARNVKRAVFLKPHVCARATFTIPEDLPQDPQNYKVGLFATPGVHDAWVRISSDTIPQVSDLDNNTIGFAVKVLNVPEVPKILPGEENFTTHDFVTQNHHVFFSDTAKDFLEFNNAAFANQLDAYFTQHPTSKAILDAMAKPVSNILQSRFWSTTPYRFGSDYAKYRIKPCSEGGEVEPLPPAAQRNYLRTRLLRDLAATGGCFELQVQIRRGPQMPLDQATVAWSETDSVPQTVARINIPVQQVAQNDALCENMEFTAWHALPAHRPVGSINKARGLIYKKLSDLRRSRNGVPIAEPQ